MTYENNPAPFSQDAEEAVLGSILIDPYAFAAVRLLLRPEDFYILRHAYIFEAMDAVARTNDVVDYLTVKEALRIQNRLNDIGGPGYLTQLIANTPTSVHVDTYARLVQRAAVRRRLMTAADELRSMAMDEDKDLDAVLAEATQRFQRVFPDHEGDQPGQMRDLIGDYIDYVQDTHTLPSGVTGLASGYKQYDELMDGYQKSSLNLIAARPAMGKSALLLCIAILCALRGQRVYFWSGEMNRKELRERLISVYTGVPTNRIRRGVRENGMSQEEWLRVIKASDAMVKMPIIIDDKAKMTPAELEQRVTRTAYRQGSIDVVIADYLQLMVAPLPPKASEEERLSYISRELKVFAQSHGPVVAAAQLNRELEKRQNKRPQLSDLRGSGALEQNADTVTFIYRDVVYNEETLTPNLAELIVAKNRHGATGTVNLHYEKSQTKFTDAITERLDLSTL